jgi:hypothetical protein
MTKDEALKLALEALESALSDDQPYIVKCGKAIAAIKEALAQPEQEPVCWVMPDGKTVDKWGRQFYGSTVGEPLYTAPQQRPWVSLTDEEIQDCYKAAYKVVQGRRLEVSFARAIEAKLKEKNT